MLKPEVYAPIPDAFDQQTQYIVQEDPVDMGDHIFYDIEIRELPPDVTEATGDPQ